MDRHRAIIGSSLPEVGALLEAEELGGKQQEGRRAAARRTDRETGDRGIKVLRSSGFAICVHPYVVIRKRDKEVIFNTPFESKRRSGSRYWSIRTAGIISVRWNSGRLRGLRRSHCFHSSSASTAEDLTNIARRSEARSLFH